MAFTGFGLGAFLDGIVFHQILQWHHLVSGYRGTGDLAGLEYNTFWDGIFHVAAWLIVGVGLFWLVGSGRDLRALSLRRFLAYLLIGWGTFNLTDQVVFHILLAAHHIRMVDNYLVYDLTYTALGLALLAGGVTLVRQPQGQATARERLRPPPS